jgi:hypothetical protein
MARVLVSSGFLWIALWAVFGSLLGARLNEALRTEDAAWLASTQRELLRSAHAHMNAISYGLVLMGVTWTSARREVSERAARLAALSALFGTFVFGIGLVGEAFAPSTREGIAVAAWVSAAGGLGVIFAFGAWGSFFLKGVFRP